MVWYTHIVAGSTLTALSMALFNGQNIMQTKVSIVCTVVCSLLPDIDTPKSPIAWLTGNKVHRFSSRIMATFGHRTITHSVWALAFVALVAWALGAIGTGVSASVCAYAYFYHLLLDMMTVEGVPFLFPINRKWVLPGNRHNRFSTGKMETELLVCGVSCLIATSCYSLVQFGGWTTYNAAFATQRTLHSEFVRSKDMLQVNYNYKIGNETKMGTGLVVEAQEAKTVIWENSSFRIIEDGKNGTVVKQMDFTHTQRTFAIETKTFVAISADSLNRIVSAPTVAIDIICSGRAKVNELGVASDFATLKREYANGLSFYTADSNYVARPFVFVPSALAKLKRNEIAVLREEYNLRLSQYQDRQNELQRLLSEDTKEPLRREENMRRIAKLKVEQAPQYDEIRTRQIEFEAQTAEAQEALNVEMRRNEHERSERERASAFGKNLFSGTIKILVIR
jgi:inner membrane protein